jgi:hypothetical protein
MKTLKGEPVWISLQDVDVSPGPYTMSFGFDLTGLLRSIERIGVLNSPLIERDAEGRIHVIAGYRRILALKELQRKDALCIDLSPLRLPSREKLLVSLYDNLATRKFNEVEKGMILESLSRHHSREEILGVYMPLLGLPAHESHLNVFLSLGSLEEEIRLALVRRQISLNAVQSLMEMDPESRSVVFGWLSELMFNFNQQMQFIAFIDDISSSHDQAITQTLSRRKLVALMKDQRLNRPQRAKFVLEKLRSMRYPSLATAQKAFGTMVKQLNLPDGVRVRHPPFFERPDYSLELSFRDGRELRQRLKELESVEGLEALGDPWKKRP